MRDSPSLDMIPELIKNNCELRLFDPEGMHEAKKESLKNIQKNIRWCKDSYDECNGVDALVILTEWNQFRALDLVKLKKILNIRLLLI